MGMRSLIDKIGMIMYRVKYLAKLSLKIANQF